MQTLRLDVINIRTTKVHPSGNKITGLQTFHVPGIWSFVQKWSKCNLLCYVSIAMPKKVLCTIAHVLQDLGQTPLGLKAGHQTKLWVRTQFSLRKPVSNVWLRTSIFLYLTFTIFSHYPKDVTKNVQKHSCMFSSS